MSVAVAIALGAASMSDIAVLAQLAPVPGAAPGGSTARRGAGQTSAGFPWLVIAGKTLTGWVVIDMDATLVTAHPNSLYSPNYLYSPSRLTLPLRLPRSPVSTPSSRPSKLTRVPTASPFS
jgi:hypothetical protein